MISDEMQAILEMMAAAPPMSGTVEEQRAGLEETVGATGPPTGTEIELIELDDFDAEWIHGPDVGDSGALLYLHGGGYCIGSIGTHRALAARLSEASGLAVLLPGYRLGPEHPFPAAVDDAVTGYRWLLDRGFGSDQLAIAGDSAGGGLTAAALLAIREQDVDGPAGAALLSPWVDLTQSGPSMHSNAESDPLVDKEGLGQMASWYLAGAAADDPLASPLFGDLRGLPPLLIQVGAPEILLDDATRFAERAEQAGVEVSLEVWPDVFHVWQASAGMTPEGDEAVARIGEFLAARVAG